MKKILVALAATGGAALIAAGPVQAAQVSHKARTFMDNAAQTNLAEIQEGQLAEQKTSSPQVRQLAQMMVRDHEQMNQQLEQLAQQDGVTLPKQPDRHERHQLQELKRLSGAQFDRTFAQDQIKDHEVAIQKFQRAAQTLTDPQVKELAQQSIPILQKHLQMARQTETALGGTSTSG
jgi:putative membrane protein